MEKNDAGVVRSVFLGIGDGWLGVLAILPFYLLLLFAPLSWLTPGFFVCFTGAVFLVWLLFIFGKFYWSALWFSLFLGAFLCLVISVVFLVRASRRRRLALQK